MATLGSAALLNRSGHGPQASSVRLVPRSISTSDLRPTSPCFPASWEVLESQCNNLDAARMTITGIDLTAVDSSGGIKFRARQTDSHAACGEQEPARGSSQPRKHRLFNSVEASVTEAFLADSRWDGEDSVGLTKWDPQQDAAMAGPSAGGANPAVCVEQAVVQLAAGSQELVMASLTGSRRDGGDEYGGGDLFTRMAAPSLLPATFPVSLGPPATAGSEDPQSAQSVSRVAAPPRSEGVKMGMCNFDPAVPACRSPWAESPTSQVASVPTLGATPCVVKEQPRGVPRVPLTVLVPEQEDLYEDLNPGTPNLGCPSPTPPSLDTESPQRVLRNAAVTEWGASTCWADMAAEYYQQRGTVAGDAVWSSLTGVQVGITMQQAVGREPWQPTPQCPSVGERVARLPWGSSAEEGPPFPAELLRASPSWNGPRTPGLWQQLDGNIRPGVGCRGEERIPRREASHLGGPALRRIPRSESHCQPFTQQNCAEVAVQSTFWGRSDTIRSLPDQPWRADTGSPPQVQTVLQSEGDVSTLGSAISRLMSGSDEFGEWSPCTPGTPAAPTPGHCIAVQQQLELEASSSGQRLPPQFFREKGPPEPRPSTARRPPTGPGGSRLAFRCGVPSPVDPAGQPLGWGVYFLQDEGVHSCTETGGAQGRAGQSHDAVQVMRHRAASTPCTPSGASTPAKQSIFRSPLDAISPQLPLTPGAQSSHQPPLQPAARSFPRSTTPRSSEPHAGVGTGTALFSPQSLPKTPGRSLPRITTPWGGKQPTITQIPEASALNISQDGPRPNARGASLQSPTSEVVAAMAVGQLHSSTGCGWNAFERGICAVQTPVPPGTPGSSIVCQPALPPTPRRPKSQRDSRGSLRSSTMPTERKHLPVPRGEAPLALQNSKSHQSFGQWTEPPARSRNSSSSSSKNVLPAVFPDTTPSAQSGPPAGSDLDFREFPQVWATQLEGAASAATPPNLQASATEREVNGQPVPRSKSAPKAISRTISWLTNIPSSPRPAAPEGRKRGLGRNSTPSREGSLQLGAASTVLKDSSIPRSCGAKLVGGGSLVGQSDTEAVDDNFTDCGSVASSAGCCQIGCIDVALTPSGGSRTEEQRRRLFGIMNPTRDRSFLRPGRSLRREAGREASHLKTLG